MKRIEVTVSMGLQGCKRTSIIEVEDDNDDDDIEELAREAMFEMVSWNWRELPKKASK